MAKKTTTPAKFSRKRRDPATSESSAVKFTGFNASKSSLLQPDRPKFPIKPPSIHPHRKKTATGKGKRAK